MSRRSGQSGYIEKKGAAFFVRFWLDVPGQEKRAHKSVRICPASGPGRMTKPERERRAKQIIAESGADTEKHFETVSAINLGVTFRDQAKWFLNHAKTRKRNPIKPSTASSWSSHLAWINPLLGDFALASVNNLALKDLVSKMSEADFSPKTMRNYLQVVKMVVASAINDQGEEIYPRKWNHKFIDLPQVDNQRTPIFTAEEMTKIVSKADGQYSVLFAVLGGTGLRIGEALALEVRDFADSTIRVRQGVWNGIVQTPKTLNGIREIDVPSSLAQLLKIQVGNRESGFLFQNSTARPLSQSNVRNRHLYPILKILGREKCGFHAFRRFRVTHLRKLRVPEDLLNFWIGHGNKSVTDGYSKIKEDREFRRDCAEKAGLGFEFVAQYLGQELDVVPSCTQVEVTARES